MDQILETVAPTREGQATMDAGVPDRSIARSAEADRGPVLVERGLAVLVVYGGAYAAWFLFRHGYLPQPFYYKVGGSLTDLFDTAYWAVHPGAYDVWRSLYPPLPFDLLRLVADTRCYAVSGAEARACDGRLTALLLAFHLLNGVLVYVAFRRLDPKVALPRALAVWAGLPMLYALERGNLLIPCFTCFVLAYGGLLRGRLRWVALALSINFKPYLLIALIPLPRRAIVSCVVVGLSIYLLSYVALGSGTPLQLFKNETQFGVSATDQFFANIYYATSFWPVAHLLQAAPPGVASPFAGLASPLRMVLVALIRSAQAGVVACLFIAAARPQAVVVRRFAAMCAAISLTAFTTGSAGYVQIFLFFLIFFEPWRGPVRIAVIASTYVLCIPADLILWPIVHGSAFSYLGGREVMTDFGWSLGQLLRPALLLVIQFGLIAMNLADLLGSEGPKAGGAWPAEIVPRVAAAHPRL